MEKAIEIDPKFTPAIAYLGWSHHIDAQDGRGESKSSSWQHALDAAKLAISLDPDSADAHTLLGSTLINHLGAHDQGIAELTMAVDLAPNDAGAVALLGIYLSFAGRSEEGLEMAKRAMRLEPLPEDWFYNALGSAYLFAGYYEEAIAALKECLRRIPEFLPPNVSLVYAFMEAGQEDEARVQAKDVLRIDPNFSGEWYLARIKNPGQMSRVKTLLQRAGLDFGSG
ncbi:MAG: hypothetical protein O7A67_11450 [SAR324 cluster bacterium]|nr:hypothetical protein [SAR324 cluster bacterium]